MTPRVSATELLLKMAAEGGTKIKVNTTFRRDVLAEIDKICEEKGVTRSGLLNAILIDWLNSYEEDR